MWTALTVEQFEESIKTRYTSVGCYPLFWITEDGGVLCWECCVAEQETIKDSIRERNSDGWRVIACDANWEDQYLYCDHCSTRIESAYGDEEEE